MSGLLVPFSTDRKRVPSLLQLPGKNANIFPVVIDVPEKRQGKIQNIVLCKWKLHAFLRLSRKHLGHRNKSASGPAGRSSFQAQPPG